MNMILCFMALTIAKIACLVYPRRKSQSWMQRTTYVGSRVLTFGVAQGYKMEEVIKLRDSARMEL